MMLLCTGVHTAGNIDVYGGRQQCSYTTCLLGACVALPILLVSTKLDVFITYSCLCSVIAANLYHTSSVCQSPYIVRPVVC